MYLDNNASTPLLPEAWEAMRPYFLDHPGNPASSHAAGRHARRALEDARERIAHLLDAHPDEVVFTSGATEANNLAIFGLALPAPGTLVTSAIEHPCVVEPIQQLAKAGFATRNLPVAPAGTIDAERAAFPDDVRLVSVMLANHETGAVQPITQLAERLAGRAPFHCDAAAAVGKTAVSFRRLGVTALTVSAHKFHGPKGVGALLVRRDAKFRPLFWGGHQQHGKRPGTEPVPLAVGMAVALDWCVRKLESNRAKVAGLRERLLTRLRAGAAPVVVNGPETGGLPHTLNLSFPGCRADALLMRLDLAGVACSTGSACSSGSLLPSPVLAAMGVTPEALRSAVRFSLSSLLTEAAIDEASGRIILVVNDLRHRKADNTE
jgi:cysteine desulfurase